MFEGMFADTITRPVEGTKLVTYSVYEAIDLAIPMT